MKPSRFEFGPNSLVTISGELAVLYLARKNAWGRQEVIRACGEDITITMHMNEYGRAGVPVGMP